MRLLSSALVLALAAASTVLLAAQSFEPLRSKCEISPSTDGANLSLHTFNQRDCPEGNHCGSNFSNESMNRFSGVTLLDLANDGAHLTATLKGEAGAFTCTGTVHDHELYGDAVFTPDTTFVDRMGKLGFTGYDSQKLQAYTFLDVTNDFARSLQQANIKGVTTDNLIALRIFKIDPAYAQGFVSMGYEQPDAGKLIGLKVQGVNAEEVRQIRDLGFKPTLDELIQIRIFHITPEFVHRMQGRGLKDLTISKLVQIKIFKLDE
jgi:hypothetical protein